MSRGTPSRHARPGGHHGTTTRDIAATSSRGSSHWTPSIAAARAGPVLPGLAGLHQVRLHPAHQRHLPQRQKMTADDVIASVNRWMSDAVTAGTSSPRKGHQSGPDKSRSPHRSPVHRHAVARDASQPPVVMPASVIANKGRRASETSWGPVLQAGGMRKTSSSTWKNTRIHLAVGPPSGLAGEKKPGVDNLYYDIVPDASPGCPVCRPASTRWRSTCRRIISRRYRAIPTSPPRSSPTA